MHSTAITKMYNGVLVFVQGRQSPSEESFAEMMAALRRPKGAFFGILGSSPGGSPTPVQRDLMIPELKRHGVPIAVLTSSAKTRGVLTVVSWAGPFAIRPFPFAKVDDALRFLGHPLPFTATKITVAELRRQSAVLNPR